MKSELEAYAVWLREKRMTSDHKIQFFVGWVERFLRLQSSRPNEAWGDTLRIFLEDLGEGLTRGWQLRQAADAVTLFCGQYRERQVAGVATDAHETGRSAVSGSGVGGQRPGGKCAIAGALDASQLLAEMRQLLRLRHYAYRTERSYLGWAQRFLVYVDKTTGVTPTPDDVKSYLSYLAVQRNVAASTQNQAFNALLFLFRYVLMVDLGDMGTTVRARRGRRLPVVLMPEEARAVFNELQGLYRLMLELVYGSGLRVSELVQLRVKDVDYAAGSITVRASKGDKDRVTFLPKRLVRGLQDHLAKVKELHKRDLAAGAGEAPLPDALKRKYPNAGREWGWQFVFPSTRLNVGDDGVVRRWRRTYPVRWTSCRGLRSRYGNESELRVVESLASSSSVPVMVGIALVSAVTKSVWFLPWR